MLPRAYDLIVQLKQLFRFGKLALPKSSGCADACAIIEEMELQASGQRSGCCARARGLPPSR
jgi:hypothetical protein